MVPHTRPPPWVTADFLYTRFVGDRALSEFSHVQRDGTQDLDRMRRFWDEEGRLATTVYAYANNHFMGFGPGTIEALAHGLGEPPVDLSAAARPRGQTRLEGDRETGPPKG